jgi:hypothetical protein
MCGIIGSNKKKEENDMEEEKKIGGLVKFVGTGILIGAMCLAAKCNCEATVQLQEEKDNAAMQELHKEAVYKFAGCKNAIENADSTASVYNQKRAKYAEMFTGKGIALQVRNAAKKEATEYMNELQCD